MDFDKDYPISDLRFLRNNIIRNRIKEQLSPIQKNWDYLFTLNYSFLLPIL